MPAGTFEAPNIPAPFLLRLSSAALTVQAAVCLIVPMTLVAGVLIASGCVVAWIFGGLAAVFLFLLLWPVAGFVILVASKITQRRPWALGTGVGLALAQAALAITAMVHGWLGEPFWVVLLVLALVIGVPLLLPLAAQAARDGPVPDPATAENYAADAAMISAAGAIGSSGRNGSAGAALFDMWATVGMLMLHNRRVRRVLALSLGVAIGGPLLLTLSAPTVDAQGIPLKPSAAQLLAYPEAQLAPPGASAYSSEVQPAGCSPTASASNFLSTTQSGPAVIAWYDAWLRQHGWHAVPAHYFTTIIPPAATRSYRRGLRESFDLATFNTRFPPHFGADSVPELPSNATVFLTSFAIDPPAGAASPSATPAASR
jgi:hypothetical protein